MLHLIPAPAHRIALRVAYRLRRRYRRMARPDIAGVAVILRDEAERVLLVRHSYGPEGWAIPGGGLGESEDPAEAARREIAEELGVGLIDLELLDTVTEQLSRSSHTAYIFTARPDGEPRVDGREIVEARWFAVAALPGLTITPISKRRLRERGML
ncbi:NUDIX hydrolase [Aurantiacibacter gangjinensis]|uniref:Uncharacterized protein n=1 Tax=Aurantiacibacter gangjinensis TaxID=502682 RepID=A0A0G9MME2_9SPHN|nr:NUDIX domain-containing protein [Aurantiacibacter gangjinensis]APE27957.1 MutT/nudix family protein [Aurantiacibacter gangjinensis]KLE31901.1 hypothetical protein AAW01_10645 [Aurantiacibacter gangjinensis]